MTALTASPGCPSALTVFFRDGRTRAADPAPKG